MRAGMEIQLKKNSLQTSLSKFSNRDYITFPSNPTVWEAGRLDFLVCGFILRAEVGEGEGEGRRELSRVPEQ